MTALRSGVVGRGRPELMKPHPDSVLRALDILDRPPAQCVLIGDSVTDIEVSRATGLRSIGYATTPIRGNELHLAGADAITDSNHALAEHVRHSRQRARRPWRYPAAHACQTR
jgi:phosphoglycolate phosphatase-like HAD superfamily hydrolase